ncbi:hypothetical protein FACS189451_03780 [Bacteroidia bacterium]|nr:hypothetical protein FACS189446_1580 [Bacteroidia bacterium]GHT61545.1 hypothetical protein FACS189451_03780 [Bacteroidia bacterium]
MKNKKKDILEREDAMKFFRMGEKFAEKLKLQEKIEKINKYGNEKPQMAFFWIFVIVGASFILGWGITKVMEINLFKTIPVSLQDKKPQEQALPLSDPMEDFQKEMVAIYEEMQTLADTISKTTQKETLTHADSAFIAEKYQRLKVLDKIINEQFNKE